MKKKMIVLICLLGMGLSSLFAQQREAAPVAFKKISERLYEVVGGRGARGGCYIGDHGVLLIDAKQDENSVNQVLDCVKKQTDLPVTYLVSTHSDGDHIWGNQFYPQTVTFIAHENCRKEYFHPKRDGSASDWEKSELAPFVPSLTFRDKMDLYLGSKKVELWYFGVGHTTGDAVVYFPEEKVAFLGDQFFFGRPQLIHSYKGGNSFGHVATLTRVLETLDADKFCSGHSEMANRSEIQNHIDQMKTRQSKVKILMDQGKDLEAVLAEFPENEGRLVSSIYDEIKKTGERH
jgi:cyclase